MSVRITQLPVETSIEPSTGKARVTQVATETSIEPSIGRVRISQIAVETSMIHVPNVPRAQICIIC